MPSKGEIEDQESVEAEAEEPQESPGGEAPESAEDERHVLHSEIREALRKVVDPEIGIDVVTLGLIRDVVVGPDEVEIKMVFTTPFCPYGGILLQQVRDMARTATDRHIKVTLLDEVWSPDMMEGGDWSDWGLI